MGSAGQDSATNTKKPLGSPPSKSFSGLLIITGLIAFSAIVAGLYATAYYKRSVDHELQLDIERAKTFEAVFKELELGRFRSMGIGADTLIQAKRSIVEPFVKADQKELIKNVDPIFEILHKAYGVARINFWTPPATIFYSAGATSLGIYDQSKERPLIVEASKRQDHLNGIETGYGGIIGIRSVVPIFWEGKYRGSVEFVSNFDMLLDGAAQETGFKWALGLSEDRYIEVHGTQSDKHIVENGSVFTSFSDDAARQILKDADIHSSDNAAQVTRKDDRFFFAKTIPISNFVGIPNIRIVILEELTQQYQDAYTSALKRGLTLFLVILAALLYGYFKIDHFKASILGSLGAERRLLQERLSQGDEAIKKLKEAEIVRRQGFYNLMTVINQPLQGMVGQLKLLVETLETQTHAVSHEIKDRVKFIANQSGLLQNLVSDFLQIELIRHEMNTAQSRQFLAAEALTSMMEELLLSNRTRHLIIKANLTNVRSVLSGDQEIFTQAIKNLIFYTTLSGDGGSIEISASVDEDGWITISTTGSAYSGAIAPKQTLLDEGHYFLKELSTGLKPDANVSLFMGLYLAKIIIESLGGTLSVSTQENPGFVIRLPESL